MDFCKRDAAPVTDKAWSLVAEEATRGLRTNLSARRIVNVVGPKGLDFAAVGLGRLDVPAEQPLAGVRFGVHRVLPLVELRASFELDIWELDNADRGARDVDLAPVLRAAKEVSAVEERAVYEGLAPAGITGMRPAAQHSALDLGPDARTYPDVVARALLTLREVDVHGACSLVLGPKPFRALEGTSGTYPPSKQIQQLVGGSILLSPFIEGGFLVATSYEGLELTLGQDFALCYESHDAQTIKLSLTESFTFRVLDPRVFVPLAFRPQ